MKDLHMDEDSLYYELEIEVCDDQIQVCIRDITQIVRAQQKLSDKMYQDAIEANYSHE
jgi:hypothetical protein